MKQLTYKVTGKVITIIKKLLGIKLRITGDEHVQDRPTLYAVNHFTRLETFLVPYVLYLFVKKQVHSLATDSIFKGIFSAYWHACGVISVKDPRRNRMVISDLLTGKHSWIIFPEGGIIKNKRTVKKGRLHLKRPDREGPPHTGAALLALKAQICKRRFLKALAKGDQRRLKYYKDKYGLTTASDVDTKDIVIVPLSITYCGLRPGKNLVYRIAHFFKPQLHPQLEEELQVEGNILLGNTEISMHFSPAISVNDFLDAPTRMVRKIVGLFKEDHFTELMIKRQATRLTSMAMRSIYNNLEVNVDHIFCYGLRSIKQTRISKRTFHRSLYMAVLQLRTRDDVRLHPILRNGVTSIMTGHPFEPLDSIIQLAQDEGVIVIENDEYIINSNLFSEPSNFHTVRLDRMVKVIANEIESIQAAAEIISHAVNTPEDQLDESIATAIVAHDRVSFIRQYDSSENGVQEKDQEFGEPFLLKVKNSNVGIVLAHGYLACPQEIRLLAEYLNKAGYLVYGVRLEGHGTSPKHLGEVDWHEWKESFMRGYGVVKNTCDKVVLGGFSLGGILALSAAAQLQDRVDAVFSINAPLILRDRRVPLVPALLHWNAVMKKFGVKAANSEIRNESESPDLNYNINHLSGVRELRRAVRWCRKNLQSVISPTLIIQASDDPVVSSESGAQIINRIGAVEKTLSEPEFSRHVIIRGERSECVFETVESFLENVLKKIAIDERAA